MTRKHIQSTLYWADTWKFNKMNKNDQYTIKKDRQSAFFNFGFGLLFIVWSIFDIATGFFEEFWYANIFFILLGLLFIIWGYLGFRSAKAQAKIIELDENKL